MKLICQREQMAEAFAKAATFTARSDNKPILQMVKVEANGKVTLLATDLEVGCRINCEGVQVEKPGSAMLPVDRIGGLLKESTDEVIQIEATGNKVTVKTNRGSFAMNATSIGEFPDPAACPSGGIEVSSDVLKLAIPIVAECCDVASTRYALGGVFFDYDDKNSALDLVGCDGARLASYRTPANFAGKDSPGGFTVLREQSIRAIVRALPLGSAVTIHRRENDCLFSCGENSYYARLIEGRYPNWRSVFCDRGCSLRMPCGQLLSALRQVSLMLSREKDAMPWIDMSFGDSLTLGVTASERGTAELEIPIALDGAPCSLAINCVRLIDWLSTLGPDRELQIWGGDQVQIEAFDGALKFVLNPVDRKKAIEAAEEAKKEKKK